jgi:hypothetical protein
MAAMRQALEALGDESAVLDIQAWVEKQFGINIPKNMVSSYKSTILRRKPGFNGYHRPRLIGTTHLTGGVSIADVQLINDLIARIGAQRIHELVDVLGR